MDGPRTVPRILLSQLRRDGEPTRLASQWMAQAYERLYPIQPPTSLAGGDNARPAHPEPIAPPRVAAGGSA